jgi:hypothetical protein
MDPLQGIDSLHTLAEVSVALAGFASLLLVLRRDPSTSLSEGEGADLFVVVGTSLLVGLFALLPPPLRELGLSEPSVWIASCLLLAASISGGYAVLVRRRWQLLQSGFQPSHLRVSQVAIQLPWILVMALALSALDLFVPRGAGAYVLILILLLTLGALPLVLLVFDLAGGSRP